MAGSRARYRPRPSPIEVAVLAPAGQPRAHARVGKAAGQLRALWSRHSPLSRSAPKADIRSDIAQTTANAPTADVRRVCDDARKPPFAEDAELQQQARHSW